jgi:hypothetical protein
MYDLGSGSAVSFRLVYLMTLHQLCGFICMLNSEGCGRKFMAYFKVFSSTCLERREKLRVASNVTKIQVRHLKNASLKCYCYTKLLSTLFSLCL